MSTTALAVKPQPAPFMLVDNLVSIYDDVDGETADRYTAVINFDASYEFNGSKCVFFGFDAAPSHPLGIGQSGESDKFINKPTNTHLGKRIFFSELPEKAQQALWAWIVGVYSPLGGN